MGMKMMKQKLPAEKRIELVHVSLMRHPNYALFAGLFMVGKVSVVDTRMTACTNGRDVKYGRAFVDGLTDKELAFLVMHENMHKCYRHLTIWRALNDIDHNLSNRACDYVINVQLHDMDPQESILSHPRKDGEIMGCMDVRFRGMDTRQVFDILRKEKKERLKGDKCDKSEPGAESGESDSDVDNSDDDFDDHDWDGAKELPEDEKKKLGEEIDQALRQGAIYAGKVGGNMLREITELLTPKVDWREVLRRFIRTHLKDRDSPSWRRAHKNYLWQDIILPSIVGKRVKHLVFATDTSGSVVGELLAAFLTELNKAVKDVNPDRVDVLYWDTEITSHEIYSSDREIVSKTSPKGGGGTDPDCIPPFMNEKKLKPDALIILTDGYMTADAREWDSVACPILWCVIGNNRFTLPKGQLVRIDEV
jgi:predicted metal-dependent peptidase